MTIVAASSRSNAPIIEADCVSKRYGHRLVLKAASLRVRPGDVTALVGRNGEGKSTLFRILSGLLQPDGGNVRVDGVALERVTLPYLARRGLFFLADRDLLHPDFTIGAQLTDAAAVSRSGTPALEFGERLGISARFDQKPGQLSGGERRRAEFAFALACAPRILVADEPLRGIAPLDAEVIMTELRRFALAGGAVALTGHELSLLLPHVDRITWCTAGTTREFPSIDAATNDFAFRRDFAPDFVVSTARAR